MDKKSLKIVNQLREKPLKVVDITPTWVDVLPMMLLALEQGSDEGKTIAKEELLRMAKAADQANNIKPAIEKALDGWSVGSAERKDILDSNTLVEMFEKLFQEGYNTGSSAAQQDDCS